MRAEGTRPSYPTWHHVGGKGGFRRVLAFLNSLAILSESPVLLQNDRATEGFLGTQM